MQKTNNYQLNQWDPEDRIQMKDFNGDNANLDAALKNLADQMSTKAERAALEGLRDMLVPTFIKEVSVETSAKQITVEVSDIDWDQWREVYVDAELLCAAPEGSALSYCNIYINTFSSSSSASVGSARCNDSSVPSLAESTVGQQRLVLYPRHNAANYINTRTFGSSSVLDSSSTRFSGLTALVYRNPSSDAYQVLAGSRFLISGVK